MGNARKNLFFGREAFPSITCSICNSLDPDTWLHVLLKCRQHHIHVLRIKRHDKVVWALRKLLVSTKKSRCYILIEFIYCNDRFSLETITLKEEKYQVLKDNIRNKGWNVEPLMVITTGAKATAHIPSMKIIEAKFNIPEQTIRNTFSEINTIAIHHAMSIILHKRKIENNEPL